MSRIKIVPIATNRTTMLFVFEVYGLKGYSVSYHTHDGKTAVLMAFLQQQEMKIEDDPWRPAVHLAGDRIDIDQPERTVRMYLKR